MLPELSVILKSGDRGRPGAKQGSTFASEGSKRIGRAGTAALAVLVLVAAALASAAELPSEFLPLAEVKPGMKGYALSVFRGGTVERFGVEVIGVQTDVAPDRARIYVKVSGQGLEESGVAAGMSGSPVYLDERLAGAIAVGWAFSKSPIGGVTPIEAMLAIEHQPARGTPAPTGGRRVALSAWLPRDPDESESERLVRLQGATASLLFEDGPIGSEGGLLGSIANGFPAGTLERFGAALSRMGIGRALAAPSLSAPSSSSPAAVEPLTPGASIAALLVSGDLQLAAIGTVTHVFPDGRFLAFGHPFLDFGDIDLPVAKADVLTILPSYLQSFKVAVPLSAAYRLTRDGDAGVAGRSDGASRTLPVAFRFEDGETGRRREFAFRVAAHPRILPALLALTADAAMRSVDQTPPDRTLRYAVRLRTALGPVEWSDTASGPKAREIALLSTVLLATTVVDNEFGDPGLEGVELDFRSVSGERRLRIVEAASPARKVAPGGTITVSVRLAGRRDGDVTRLLKLQLPKETPEGKAIILVADGSNATAVRMGMNPAEPRSFEDLRRFLGSISPASRISAFVIVPSRGAVTGNRTLSPLPPSVAGLLAPRRPGEPSGGDVEGRIVAESGETLDLPVSGTVRIEIEVEKPRS
jgi:SpoIVB peptidase S55